MGSKSGDREYSRGQKDYKKSGGLGSSNPITEAFHPTYRGTSKGYGDGWKNAKKQDRRSGK
jgi:hypothetical protein